MGAIEVEQPAPVAIDVGPAWQGLAAQPLVGALDVECGGGIHATKCRGQILAGRAPQHHRSQAQLHGEIANQVASSPRRCPRDEPKLGRFPEKAGKASGIPVTSNCAVWASGRRNSASIPAPASGESSLAGPEHGSTGRRGGTSVRTRSEPASRRKERDVPSIVVDRPGSGGRVETSSSFALKVVPAILLLGLLSGAALLSASAATASPASAAGSGLRPIDRAALQALLARPPGSFTSPAR